MDSCFEFMECISEQPFDNFDDAEHNIEIKSELQQGILMGETKVKTDFNGDELLSEELLNCGENQTKEGTPRVSSYHRWEYDHTLNLIAAVEANYDDVSSVNPNIKKNAWENISNYLISYKYSPTPLECKKKWSNLMQTYNKTKDLYKSGRGSTRFLFFRKIDDILGSKAIDSSPLTLDVSRLVSECSCEMQVAFNSHVPVAGTSRMPSTDTSAVYVANSSTSEMVATTDLMVEAEMDEDPAEVRKIRRVRKRRQQRELDSPRTQKLIAEYIKIKKVYFENKIEIMKMAEQRKREEFQEKMRFEREVEERKLKVFEELCKKK